ncbi:hypothetical protein LINPERHAP1_LOCUS706, partial [Linum perenne]
MASSSGHGQHVAVDPLLRDLPRGEQPDPAALSGDEAAPRPPQSPVPLPGPNDPPPPAAAMAGLIHPYLINLPHDEYWRDYWRIR